MDVERRTTSFACRILAISVMVGGVVSAGQAQVEPRSVARAAFMRAHFAEALKLHDAVARGDLAAARDQAERLAAHRPDVAFPAGAASFFQMMSLGARDVSEARTMEQAGRATATLLSQCGQCHAAMQVRNAIPAAPASEVGGLVGQMRAHLRASDLLLEGLVGPSPAQWRAGARELAAITLRPGDMPERALRERARLANARFAELAAAAAGARDTRERAEIYGGMLVTCARCHQEHPKIWGPDRR
jgi:hypothetical protein